MKSTQEPQDRDLTLGAPIREPKPAAAPTPVAPGIVKNSDGKLETRISPPSPGWLWTYGTPTVRRDEQCED